MQASNVLSEQGSGLIIPHLGMCPDLTYNQFEFSDSKSSKLILNNLRLFYRIQKNVHLGRQRKFKEPQDIPTKTTPKGGENFLSDFSFLESISPSSMVMRL